MKKNRYTQAPLGKLPFPWRRNQWGHRIRSQRLRQRFLLGVWFDVDGPIFSQLVTPAFGEQHLHGVPSLAQGKCSAESKGDLLQPSMQLLGNLGRDAIQVK